MRCLRHGFNQLCLEIVSIYAYIKLSEDTDGPSYFHVFTNTPYNNNKNNDNVKIKQVTIGKNIHQSLQAYGLRAYV